MNRARRPNTDFLRNLNLLLISNYETIDRSTYFLIFILIIGSFYILILFLFTFFAKPLTWTNRVFPFNDTMLFLPNF